MDYLTEFEEELENPTTLTFGEIISACVTVCSFVIVLHWILFRLIPLIIEEASEFF